MTCEVVRRCNYYVSGTFQEAGLLDRGDQVDILEKRRPNYNKSIWGTFEKDGQVYDVLIRTRELQVLKEVKDGKSAKRSRKNTTGRDSK